MKYKRFEDLPVWSEALRLALNVYEITKDRAFSTSGDLRDQLRRASLSISNNIAEGFERGSTSELLYFLYIARGSAAEVRSMLCFCVRWPEAAPLQQQISALLKSVESCSRQIQGWAESLQNSEVKGLKHLNDRVRRDIKERREREEFLQYLEDIRKGASARPFDPTENSA